MRNTKTRMLAKGSASLLGCVPGAQLKDTYTIMGKIGKGGMAWVYQAHHDKLEEEVAIKVLYPHLAEEAKLRARFLEEARIQFKLKHPNIVQVFDVIESEALFGIVLEWMNRGNLKELLARLRRPLPPAWVWFLMEPVFEALQAAHDRGIIHRDVKPANLLLHLEGKSLRTKIADFGIAKLLDDVRPDTTAGRGLGTLVYMAPEQLSGATVPDHRVDIYSLGVTLFQLLTHKTPFCGKEAELQRNILHSPTPSVLEHNPALPFALDEVLQTCLAKDPSQRYQNCKELAHALRKALDSEGGLSETAASLDALVDLFSEEEEHEDPVQWFPGDDFLEFSLHEDDSSGSSGSAVIISRLDAQGFEQQKTIKEFSVLSLEARERAPGFLLRQAEKVSALQNTTIPMLEEVGEPDNKAPADVPPLILKDEDLELLLAEADALLEESTPCPRAATWNDAGKKPVVTFNKDDFLASIKAGASLWGLEDPRDEPVKSAPKDKGKKDKGKRTLSLGPSHENPLHTLDKIPIVDDEERDANASAPSEDEAREVVNGMSPSLPVEEVFLSNSLQNEAGLEGLGVQVSWDVQEELDGPALDEPALDKPALDEPALDEPAMDASTLDEPAMVPLSEDASEESEEGEEADGSEPEGFALKASAATHSPALDEPALDEPALDEPAMDASTLDEPAMNASTLDEPALDEPAMFPLSEDTKEEAGDESGFCEVAEDDGAKRFSPGVASEEGDEKPGREESLAFAGEIVPREDWGDVLFQAPVWRENEDVLPPLEILPQARGNPHDEGGRWWMWLSLFAFLCGAGALCLWQNRPLQVYVSSLFGVQQGCKEGQPNAQKERCNGKDDDCDGLVDEDFPQKGQSCTLVDGDCARQGVYVCDPQKTAVVCRETPQPNTSQPLLVLQSVIPGTTLVYGDQKLSLGRSYCVKITKKTKFTLQRKGYYPCSFSARPTQTRLKLTLRRQNTNDSKPKAAYCVAASSTK